MPFVRSIPLPLRTDRSRTHFSPPTSTMGSYSLHYTAIYSKSVTVVALPSNPSLVVPVASLSEEPLIEEEEFADDELSTDGEDFTDEEKSTNKEELIDERQSIDDGQFADLSDLSEEIERIGQQAASVYHPRSTGTTEYVTKREKRRAVRKAVIEYTKFLIEQERLGLFHPVGTEWKRSPAHAVREGE